MRKYILILAAVIAAVLSSPAQAEPPWTATVLITGGVVSDNTNSAAFSCPQGKTSFSVHVPTLTSATVTLAVSHDNTNYYNFYYQAGAAAAPALWQVASGTHNLIYEFPAAACAWPYVRFTAGAAQTADRTFRLYGR